MRFARSTIFRSLAVAGMLGLAAGAALANDSGVPDAVKEAIESGVKGISPTLSVEFIRPTESPHAFAVKLSGDGSFHVVTADGRMFLARPASIMDTLTRDDLGSKLRGEAVTAALAESASVPLISFRAETEKHRLVVFTDVDCGYCRRFHEHVEEFNAAGITIDYVLYARAQEGSETWAKHLTIACAKDQHEMLTRYKRGDADIEKASCDSGESLLKQHQKIGFDVSLTGTPMVAVARDGRVIGGYVPPAQAIAALEK
jgi:thiol:disulfide interchange protein DsbC